MKTVLVVDDEEDIGILMKLMLTSAGYNVLYANNLTIATKKLEQRKVDAIFLDINLSDEYGLNLLPIIKETNGEAMIIVITAQKGKDVRRDVKNSDIRFLIEKPFNKNEIMSVLEKRA